MQSLRHKRLDYIYQTVARVAYYRNTRANRPKEDAQPILDWCAKLRAAVTDECVSWNEAKLDRFRGMLKVEADKVGEVLKAGGSNTDAANSLLPVDEFVVQFHRMQAPCLPAPRAPAMPPPSHAESEAKLRAKRIDYIYQTVARVARYRNSSKRANRPKDAPQPILDWCARLRAAITVECVHWDEAQLDHFTRMLKAEARKAGEVFKAKGSNEDAADSLLPVDEFVDQFHEMKPLNHSETSHPSHAISSSPSPSPSPFSSPSPAPFSETSHPSHAISSAPSPSPFSSPSPSPEPLIRRFVPGYNSRERDPRRDSLGEEILEDPFPWAQNAHSGRLWEHSLDKPSVTDRAARRYGYRDGQHWRAVRGW